MKKPFLIVAIALAGAAAFYVSFQSTKAPVRNVAESEKQEASKTNSVDLDSITKQPNAILPTTEEAKPIDSKSPNAASTQPDVSKKDDLNSDPFEHGIVKPVAGNANAQIASVIEAARTKSHPERFSVLIQPKPFDPVAYRADPKKYLNTPEPGRAHQPASPSKDTPRIQAIGPTRVTIKQKSSTVLRVKATPRYPVTWTAHDMGSFPNELTTITVEADESGIAETTFTGSEGAIADVNILCAAPMASGQIRYTVTIEKQ